MHIATGGCWDGLLGRMGEVALKVGLSRFWQDCLDHISTTKVCIAPNSFVLPTGPP